MNAGTYFFIGMLFLSGCAASSQPDLGNVSTMPTVVPQTPNAVQAGHSFEALGCVQQESGLDCSKSGLEKQYACDSIVDADVTGLSPELPVVKCEHYGFENMKPGIYTAGCMRQTSVEYLVSTSTGVKEINSSSAFATFFAPVENANEAAALVQALSGHSLLAPPVETAAGGFEVHVKSTLCGCHAMDDYDDVQYMINRDGSFTVTTKEIRTGQQPQICVD